MEQRIARLRTHQKNIDGYQSLLKTKLNDVEQQFLEKHLFEERFAIAMLQDHAGEPEIAEGPARFSSPPRFSDLCSFRVPASSAVRTESRPNPADANGPAAIAFLISVAPVRAKGKGCSISPTPPNRPTA
jgi:hypothetical protein